MPSTGKPPEPPFLGGYWRFIRRWTIGYILILVLAGAALLLADLLYPHLHLFQRLPQTLPP